MAKATHTPEVTEVVQEETYTLELSKQEALALSIICGQIGGNPETTARRHFTSIQTALTEAGLPDIHHRDAWAHLDADADARSIYFVKDIEL